MYNVEKYLKGAIIIALIAFSLSVIIFANSYAKSAEPSSFRSFSVSGKGEVNIVPDIAQFSFGVTTEGGKDIGNLQAENTDKMNAILKLVKDSGVKEKDIKTTQYAISPRYQRYACDYRSGKVEPCPPAEIVGYTIRQNVSVKVRDFEKIGDILSGVAVRGANNVSGLSFTIDDPDTAQDEARAEAIKDAKEKAKKVARAGGFSVGKLLSIEEGGYQPYYREYALADSAFGKGGGIEAPAIEPGSEDVTVNVTLRFEIR